MKTIVYKISETEERDWLKAAATSLQPAAWWVFQRRLCTVWRQMALDAEAAAKIYAAKGRPSDNPFVVHISDIASLTGL